MSGRPALGTVSAPRVFVLDGDAKAHDVFEVVGISDKIVRVRSPLLFEIGEVLSLRVDDVEQTARVRAHVDGVTELELE